MERQTFKTLLSLRLFTRPFPSSGIMWALESTALPYPCVSLVFINPEVSPRSKLKICTRDTL